GYTTERGGAASFLPQVINLLPFSHTISERTESNFVNVQRSARSQPTGTKPDSGFGESRKPSLDGIFYGPCFLRRASASGVGPNPPPCRDLADGSAGHPHRDRP